MNKIGSYERDLLNLSPRAWPQFLKDHSGLPGAQLNLPLAKAFMRVGTLMDFKKFVRLGPDEAPAHSPNEFLTFCGILGFGQYLSRSHDSGLLLQLQERANDSRQHVQKAVIIALQIIAKKKPLRVVEYGRSWIRGTYFEQSAVITALCSSEDIISDPTIVESVLELLDWATSSMIEEDIENKRGYEQLAQTLTEYWNVAVIAVPSKGKILMERWIKEDHPRVNTIMIKNLKDERMKVLEEEWVNDWIQYLSS